MMLNIIKWAFQRPTAHHPERKLIIYSNYTRITKLEIDGGIHFRNEALSTAEAVSLPSVSLQARQRWAGPKTPKTIRITKVKAATEKNKTRN